MDSRFTFKDFVFVVLFVAVTGAVGLAGWQFSYQEKRLNDLKGQLTRLDDTQKQQLVVLTDIRNSLRNGVTIGSGGGSGTQPGTQASGRIKRKNPDGSTYVYYPEPPQVPRNPQGAPDFATGDWLVRNLIDEPKVIAPFIEKDYYGMLTQAMVVEGLAYQNPVTFEMEPWLAESYEQSADALRVKYVLRKGITFSDGKPVTADDVVFSYKTIMTDGVDCAPLRSFFGHVVACNKLDDRTVEFVYDEPYFEEVLVTGGMYILPKHIYEFKTAEEYNRRGDLLVGTGPYKVQAWNRGQELVLARNDNYWYARPSFDRMVLKFIKNPQAALQALQNGQTDIEAPDGDQFVKFSQDPEFIKKFNIFKYTRVDSGYTFIGYNQLKPMFKDKETRQALTMLIDRKAIIKSFMKDLAKEIVGPFNPVSPQNDASIQPWPYDPEAAQKKLEAAGWKKGPDGILMRDGVKFEFEFSMGSGNPIGERIANYVKEQFAKAGIQVRITPWEFSVYTGRLDDRNFDVAFLSWSGAAEEDPYQIWHSDSIKDKGSNFISFRNAEADKLIEAARREQDTDKRMELWHKWLKIIHEEQPYTFVSVPLSRYFVDKRLKNTEPTPMGPQFPDWYVPSALQKYH